MNRRYRCALFLLFFALLLPLRVSAHPGRTDSNGGHTNHSTGEYHYHHGYPAHFHYDMDGDGNIDCPYDFVDNADHASGTTSSVQNEIQFDGDSSTERTNNSAASIELDPAVANTPRASKWLDRPIDVDQLMKDFFIFGIPAAIIAIALFFLLCKFENRIPKQIRIVVNIIFLISCLIALPATISLFSLSYVLASVAILIVFPLKGLFSKLKRPSKNITHVKVITSSQTDAEPCAKCVRSDMYPERTPKWAQPSVPELRQLPAAPSVAPKTTEPVYMMEAHNGMLVHVPESKLEAWQAAQDELISNPDAQELTENEKRLVQAIVRDIYGSKKEE